MPKGRVEMFAGGSILTAEDTGIIAAEYVSIDKLKPWVANPRKNDHAVERVVKSIERFGFGAPLLARKATGEMEIDPKFVVVCLERMTANGCDASPCD